MAPKKKMEPISGQKSIHSFFASKPKVDQPIIANVQPMEIVTEPMEQLRSPEQTTSIGNVAVPPNTAAPITVPSAEPTNVDANNAEKDLCENIGRGIRVYWKDDHAWYEGRIGKYDIASGKHLVEYDDGDEEWIDLASEKIQLLDQWKLKPKKKMAVPLLETAEQKPGKGTGKGKGGNLSKRKRAAAVIESDDEEEGEDGKSGSEYAMSEDEDDDDSVSSLAMSEEESDEAEEDEDDEEESDLEDDIPRKPKPSIKSSSKSSKKSMNTKTPAPVSTKNLQNQTTSKTVALNNGVYITPNPLTHSFRAPAVGHGPASAFALRTALDRSPQTENGTPLGDAAAASSQDASRFAARDAARFPWLHPDKIRDGNRRRPDDPDYDPSTLYIPPDWFKQQKVSEGQRQWWEFKAANWGSVLLFKMGKFYEMFEMDAHVGAECLGLSYMKGDQPHCGFPEAGYAAMAERLARAGHRVVVIEQTETPEALAKRNETRKMQGLKKDNVVRREKVAVLTRGTLTDAEMMGAVPDAQYLLSIAEEPMMKSSGGKKGNVLIGAVAVDVAAGQVLIGQWYDDELRSQLRAVLTVLSPVEVVLPRNQLSGPSRRVVLGVLGQTPLVNELNPGSNDNQFWSAHTTWERLLSVYFKDGTLPDVLARMDGNREEHGAAMMALGGCISYLKNALLDKRMLGVGRFQSMEDVVGVGRMTNFDIDEGTRNSVGSKLNLSGQRRVPVCMMLDGPALENLEILENSDGGIVGTLLAALDHCTTPFGRRRLRQWLCRPLCRVEDIETRQDAVADLIGPAEEAAGAARKALAGLADLERALACLGATGAGVGSERDAPRVVLYEDVSKKRVHAFVSTLSSLEKVQEAINAFSECKTSLKSRLLIDLVTPGSIRLPDFSLSLAEMRGAADWSDAQATGRIVPAAGVDAAYDAAEESLERAETGLKNYLKEIKAELGCRDVKYVSLNKDSHVIEVPEDVTVPRTWDAMQGKKGVKRYTNSDLKELVAAREAALDAKENAQNGILRSILGRFAEKKEMWGAAVDCIASLDALMSLAVSAACGAGAMARPKLVPWSDNAAPIFRARGLRHPAGVGTGSGGAFVPNDVELGGENAAPFVVLTGPNMGGKSTLMRQVCLAAVAAQIGAWIPAEEIELTPADAVFVRMGARDRIMLGQSTFYVELSETAAALASASRHSLVALDELGRGTATSDGAAIAAAVLDHLAGSVQCRGVFATHYHHISDSHAQDPAVSIKHMACAVTPAEETGGVDQVTFLYRLTDGACPKSYGVNVARLAGLPEKVVVQAAKVSQQAEDRGILGLKNTPLGKEDRRDDSYDVEYIRLEKLRTKIVEACRLSGEDQVQSLRKVWLEAKEALIAGDLS